MNKNKIIILAEKEIESLLLGDFYDLVAKKLGDENPKEKKNIMYDCKKICWSNHIQEQTRSYYKRNGADSAYIGDILLNFAPKVDEKLKDMEVLVKQGFMIY
ncbi:MAG: hypothetical protein RR128_08745 [Clostridium sp.]